MFENVIQISKGKCKRSPWHVGPFQIDEDTGVVECGSCGIFLTPIAVLKYLARGESMLNNRISEQKNILSKLEQKKSCKCLHCGKMTPIDRFAR